MSPAWAFIIVGAAATQPALSPPSSISAPSVAAPEPADDACTSTDPREIVVCAQKKQGYRLDPSIMDARQEADRSSRSASAKVPAAQASCSTLPTGCGTGLEGLDLLNVAVVVGTAAVRAGKGDDWLKAFRTGGPSEYQLYLQAKQRREARQAERAAASKAQKVRPADRTSAD